MNTQLTQLIQNKDLHILILTDGYNIHHISGYRGHTGMLVAFADAQYILTDSRYTEQVQIEAPEFTCIDIGHDREVKTEDEIVRLARAEQIGDEAFTEIVKFIRENRKDGLTEQRVALQLEYEMRLRGAEGTSFDTIAASGKNSSLPHAMPQPKVLEEGDFLTMDFGCMYQGYCSDMTRTIHIGSQVDAEQQKVYDTVLRAQLAALAAIKPGMVCSDVDKVARDMIAEAGYGAYFGHGLGHSVGLFSHEEPRFSMKCDAVLKPGVVITVEPGIYLPGKFGVRIEDMIVVTEDGCRNLASSPKELICV